MSQCGTGVGLRADDTGVGWSREGDTLTVTVLLNVGGKNEWMNEWMRGWGGDFRQGHRLNPNVWTSPDSKTHRPASFQKSEC